MRLPDESSETIKLFMLQKSMLDWYLNREEVSCDVLTVPAKIPGDKLFAVIGGHASIESSAVTVFLYSMQSFLLLLSLYL